MDLRANIFPALKMLVSRASAVLDQFHRSVEGNPGHHFRVREMPPRAAHFPNALVWVAPDFFQVLYQVLLQPPGIFVALQAALAGDVHRVHDLAENVELKLLVSRVADADWLGAFISRQPFELQLRQPALARQAIHDVDLRRIAGYCPQEPLAPGQCLVAMAAHHEAVQREGGVTDPAIAIVPIPNAADLLGKRGSRRRHHAAGRCVRQRLQRQERPQHLLAVRSLVGAAARPLLPPLLRLAEQLLCIAATLRLLVRRLPAQNERNALTG